MKGVAQFSLTSAAILKVQCACRRGRGHDRKPASVRRAMVRHRDSRRETVNLAFLRGKMRLSASAAYAVTITA